VGLMTRKARLMTRRARALIAKKSAPPA
jgi:hypothetical protein